VRPWMHREPNRFPGLIEHHLLIADLYQMVRIDALTAHE
jgi:hypothetical protein